MAGGCASLHFAVSRAERQPGCDRDCGRRGFPVPGGAIAAHCEEVFLKRRRCCLRRAGAAIVRSAARMQIYSVLPMEVTTHQLVAAIAATVAGFAVTLPRAAIRDR